MKTKQNKTITYDKLMKLVADRIGYYKYEVEDVLAALRDVTLDLLSDGTEVKFEHLYTLVPKINAPRIFIIKGENVQSKGSVSVKLKLSSHLKNRINKRV